MLYRKKKNYILLSDVLIIKEKQKSFQLSWYELIVANSGIILHLHKVEDRKVWKLKLWEEFSFYRTSWKLGNLACSRALNLFTSLLGLGSHKSNKWIYWVNNTWIFVILLWTYRAMIKWMWLLKIGQYSSSSYWYSKYAAVLIVMCLLSETVSTCIRAASV